MGKHALRRTSPKGKEQSFLGTCFKCGMENLPAEAVTWECQNPGNLSSHDALRIAVGDPSIIQ